MITSLPILKPIGYVKKKKYLKDNASIWIHHYFGQATEFLEGTFIFVELQEGMPIPFLTLNTQVVDDRTSIITLEDATDLYEVHHTPKQKIISLAEEFILNYSSSDSILLIEGFDVYVGNRYAGKVINQVDINNNVRVLIINHDGDEKTVPFNAELIKLINHRKQIIELDLPEHILDCNE